MVRALRLIVAPFAYVPGGCKPVLSHTARAGSARRRDGRVRVEIPVRLQSCRSVVSAIVMNNDGDILNVGVCLLPVLPTWLFPPAPRAFAFTARVQSSAAVSANAHFYVPIDYPKYMAYLQQVAPPPLLPRPSPPHPPPPPLLQHAPQPPNSPALSPQSSSLKRVISFSVYGTKLRYLVGAIKNAILAQRYFPQFEVWFYVGASTPAWLRTSLELFPHVKVIVMNLPEDHSAKLWRFRAFSSPDVDTVLVRDVDSRLNARDASSVNDFLSSGLDFHMTVDHVGHRNFLITACCFGGKTRLLRDMSEKLSAFRGGNYHWNDQDFLALNVYPPFP